MSDNEGSALATTPQPGCAPSASFALMLACTDWPASPERSRRIAAGYRELGDDWEEFCDLLERHHVVVLATRALRQAGIDVPGNLVARADKAQKRSLTLCARTLEIVRLLEDSGIHAVPIKGPLLSAMLYGDPAVRHSVDIDILVEWDRFAEGIATLEQHDYRLQSARPPWDDWRIDLWRRLAKDVTMIDPDAQFAVELHHRLKTPETLLPRLGIADATREWPLGGTRLATFSPENLFVYLSAHAATSLWDRLKWLVDIHVLLAGMDAAGIERLQAHSQAMGTGRCTALALVLVGEFWGRELPPSVARTAATDPALRTLVDASRTRLTGPLPRRSGMTSSLGRRHLMRLRDGRAYRAPVWLEIFHDRELLEQYRISRRLKWLYFPLRVALFIRRTLGAVSAS